MDAIKNIHGLWEEVRVSTLTEMNPNLMDDFEGLKTSVEEVIKDAVEIVGEVELEAGPESGTELLQPHNKNLLDKELHLKDEQREWFLEKEATPDEDAVKIVEMTRKDLECTINFVDKAVAGIERVDSNFERISTVGEMLSDSIAHYRDIGEGRLFFATATPTLSNQQPDQSAVIHIKTRPSTSKKSV